MACEMCPQKGAREVELEWQGTRKTLDLCPPCEARAREDLARAESRINPFGGAPSVLNIDLRIFVPPPKRRKKVAFKPPKMSGPFRRVKRVRVDGQRAILVLACGHAVQRKRRGRDYKDGRTPTSTHCELCVEESAVG